jgi:hypothetical protein
MKSYLKTGLLEINAVVPKLVSITDRAPAKTSGKADLIGLWKKGSTFLHISIYLCGIYQQALFTDVIVFKHVICVM